MSIGILSRLRGACSTRVGLSSAAAAAAAVVASALVQQQQVPTACASADVLVMSGDCGGTNTRLTLFKVPASHKLEMGKPPPGEVIFSKKYLNSSHLNFTDVCKVFLKEAGDTVPATCCLACAGAISDNKVTFTNVKDGWTIDGALLEKELGIGRVKLINDFEAQGYGLLTLSQDEKVEQQPHTRATMHARHRPPPPPPAPTAHTSRRRRRRPNSSPRPRHCRRSTSTAECQSRALRSRASARARGWASATSPPTRAAGNAATAPFCRAVGQRLFTRGAVNRYTCFPSEGGHAECAPALLRLLPPRRARINASLHSFLRYAPIDDLTHDLRDWMMNKFLFTGDNKGRHKEDGASARAVPHHLRTLLQATTRRASASRSSGSSQGLASQTSTPSCATTGRWTSRDRAEIST